MSKVGTCGGPIEEGQGLEERYAMANPTALVNDVAHEGRGDGMDGRDIGEVEGERRDGEVRGWRGRVRVWVGVFAVVLFD